MWVSNLQQSDDKNSTAQLFAVLSGSLNTNRNLPDCSREAEINLYSLSIKKAAIAKSEVSYFGTSCVILYPTIAVTISPFSRSNLNMTSEGFPTS